MGSIVVTMNTTHRYPARMTRTVPPFAIHHTPIGTVRLVHAADVRMMDTVVPWHNRFGLDAARAYVVGGTDTDEYMPGRVSYVTTDAHRPGSSHVYRADDIVGVLTVDDMVG